ASLATTMASVAAVASVATAHLAPPAAAIAIPPSGTDVAMADPDPPATPVQLASLSPTDPVKEYPTPAVRAAETPDKCLVIETCIDDYLWSLYERTPKVDTNKVTERIKVTVKKKGKT